MQLAAALVQGPELLVLDEPFSGRDPLGVDVLSEVLARQVGLGAAVVFSSHQLELVERICDVVTIVDEGRVVAGPHRPPAGRAQAGRWSSISTAGGRSGASRVVEALLARARPRPLPAGEVLGVGLVGLLQLVVFVVVGPGGGPGGAGPGRSLSRRPAPGRDGGDGASAAGGHPLTHSYGAATPLVGASVPSSKRLPDLAMPDMPAPVYRPGDMDELSALDVNGPRLAEPP